MNKIISYIIIFLSFLLLATPTFSQEDIDNKIDSLKAIIKSSPKEEARINNDIAELLLETDDSTLIEYINKNLFPSFKISKEEKLRSYSILGDYYLYTYQFDNATKYYLTALSISTTPEQKLSFIMITATTYIRKDYYTQALELLKQAKPLIRDNDYEHSYRYNYYLGICYIHTSNFKRGEHHLLEALKAADLMNSNLYKIRIASRLGQLKILQNEYAESLQYATEALKLMKSDSVNFSYAIAMLNLGQIYSIKKQYNIASNYFNTAISLSKMLGQNKLHAQSLLFNAQNELKNNKLEGAYKDLNIALPIFKKTHSIYSIFSAEIELAKYYRIKNDSINCLKHIAEAKSLEKQIYSTALIADFNLEQSMYYFSQKRYDNAIKHIELASFYAQNTNDKIRLYNIYSVESAIDSAIGNYAKAFIKCNLAKNLQQKFYDKTFSNYYENIQAEAELESNKEIIKVLNYEKKEREAILSKNEKTIKTQNLIIIITIIVVIFAIILLFLSFYFLRQRKKDNKILKQQNCKIKQQTEELDAQKEHLKNINKELEKVSIIAEKTDNAVRVINAEGDIVWVNNAYYDFYGYSFEEVSNLNNEKLFGINNDFKIEDLINVWYKNKQPITFQAKHIKKNEETIWTQTTLTPILNEKNKIEKMIAIDTDISLLKAAEKKIQDNNKDITESILYARNIQVALMSPFEDLKNYYPDSFTIYKPKSIVSGDFYWFHHTQDKTIIVCGDCTGHGVPGAFMSIMGLSFLNAIVKEKGIINTAEILDKMRESIITHLKQSSHPDKLNDGMDMSIVAIDKTNKTIEYAGALLPVYIIRNNKVITLAPDKMSLSFNQKKQNPFNSVSMEIEENDYLYMFTDGFYDQFGGPDNDKLKYKRFKEILCNSNKIENILEQKKNIETAFNKWKGSNIQIDDILLMGIKIG